MDASLSIPLDATYHSPGGCSARREHLGRGRSHGHRQGRPASQPSLWPNLTAALLEAASSCVSEAAHHRRPLPRIPWSRWRDSLSDRAVAQLEHIAAADARTDVQREAIRAAFLRRLRPHLSLQEIATALGRPGLELATLRNRIYRGRLLAADRFRTMVLDVPDEAQPAVCARCDVFEAARSDFGSRRPS